MKPSTLRSGAFTLHRLLSIHDNLHNLSGTALVLALDALDTREGHRLALVLLDYMALAADAIDLTADALPDRLLRSAIQASADALAADVPEAASEAVSAQKKNEKEKSALSLPLNPSYSPKKKNKEKEKATAASCERAHTCESGLIEASACFAVTDGSACSASNDGLTEDSVCFASNDGLTEASASCAVTETSDAHGGDGLTEASACFASNDDETEAKPCEPQKPSRRHAKRSVTAYIHWTPEEFMHTARNCRGTEMDDDAFKAFCLYWLQTDPRGVCLFQQQRRFSMVQRMNSWTRRDLRRKYETDQRLERIYGPAPKALPAPTLEEVTAYAQSQGLDTADAERFHQYHTAYGWTLKGRPIASWQAALRIWCTRPNTSNPYPQNNETTPNAHTTPAARPSQRPAADATTNFQQRVDDIFDEAIRRNRNENNDNHDEHTDDNGSADGNTADGKDGNNSADGNDGK